MSLDELNSLPDEELTRVLLACCAVPAWAEAVRSGRPYADLDSVLAVADRAAQRLDRSDVERALAAHPRIGERAAGRTTEADWSRREQSGVRLEAATGQQLAEGNREYEERFGRVFLVCADGLSAERVLAVLRERLGHSADVEDSVVADELRKIALLRLRRLVEDGAS